MPALLPPYRADHVGSLLRPQSVLKARDDAAAGRITGEALRAIEDDAIRDVVKMQEDVGLQAATDGEFRRGSWHMDFIYQLGGVGKSDETLRIEMRNDTEEIAFETAALKIGKLGLPKTIFADDFTFLKNATNLTPKLTVPSPSMVHYRGGPAAIDKSVYPTMDDFWDDLIAAYAKEIAGLAELGCTYLQFDDTSLAYLNDPAERASSTHAATTPSTSTSATSSRSTWPSPVGRRRCGSRRTCAAATSARRGRPRAATTPSPRRSSTTSRWTASSSSTTMRGPAGSSRCGSCPRTRWWCSAW